MRKILFIIFITINLFLFQNLFAQKKDVIVVSLELKGVKESDIRLTPFDEKKSKPAVAQFDKVQKDNIVKFNIPIKDAYGEFILQFQYFEDSKPNYAEMSLYVGNEDFMISINPKNTENRDSIIFSKGEKENTTYNSIMSVSEKQKQQLELFVFFLTNYEYKNSDFYSQAIKEFENLKTEHNSWLKENIEKYKDLYVSRIFQFEYFPEVDLTGKGEDIIVNQLTNLFDGINFNDTLLLKTRELVSNLSQYMGMWGKLAEKQEDMDSLFTKAGEIVIDKSATGHPKVYGWMVDYFYVGFESSGMNKGLKMLEKYMNDPNCLTSKKAEITRRLEGLKELSEGKTAPNFTLKDENNKTFDFYENNKNKEKFQLLLFWSADCPHCEKLTKEMVEWLDNKANNDKIDVIAISLDETETEVEKWNIKKQKLNKYQHFRAEGGINSKIAYDYYLLSTPVMFVVDPKNNVVISIPASVEDMETAINNYQNK